MKSAELNGKVQYSLPIQVRPGAAAYKENNADEAMSSQVGNILELRRLEGSKKFDHTI